MYRSNQITVLFADFSARQLLGQLVSPLCCRNTSFPAQGCEILSRTNSQFKLPPCSTTFCHQLIAVLLIAAVPSALMCVCSMATQHIPLAYMRLTQILLSANRRLLRSLSTPFGSLESPTPSLVCNFGITKLEATASFQVDHTCLAHLGIPSCMYHHNYKPSSSHYMLPPVKLSPQYNQKILINVFHTSSQTPYSFFSPEVKDCSSFLTHSL